MTRMEPDKKNSFTKRRALRPDPVLERVLERTPRCFLRRTMTTTISRSVLLYPQPRYVGLTRKVGIQERENRWPDGDDDNGRPAIINEAGTAKNCNDGVSVHLDNVLQGYLKDRNRKAENEFNGDPPASGFPRFMESAGIVGIESLGQIP